MGMMCLVREGLCFFYRKMPTITDLPIEVVERIFQFLDAYDIMATIEAAPSLEEACDFQIEVLTDFKILPKKKKLIFVVKETDCQSAMSLALGYYSEVHIILSRSVVESWNCDQFYEALRWIDHVTNGGKILFASIEIVGRISKCACMFGMLTR